MGEVAASEATTTRGSGLDATSRQLWQIINLPERIRPCCAVAEEDLSTYFSSGVIHALYLAGGGVSINGIDCTLEKVAAEVGAQFVAPGWWVLGGAAVLAGSAEDFAFHLKNRGDADQDEKFIEWLSLVFPKAPAYSVNDSGFRIRDISARLEVLTRLWQDTKFSILGLADNIGRHSKASRALLTFSAVASEEVTEVTVKAVDNGVGVPLSALESRDGDPNFDKKIWRVNRERYISGFYSDFGQDVLRLALDAVFRSDTVGELGLPNINLHFGGRSLSGLAGAKTDVVAAATLASVELDVHGGGIAVVTKQSGAPAEALMRLHLPGVRGTLVESYLADK